MPIVECTCGVRYRVPDTAVGKRVRCKKCGAQMLVPAAEIVAGAEADISALAQGDAVAVAAPPVSASVGSAGAPAAPAVARAVGAVGAAPAAGVGHMRAYLTSIGRTFLLPFQPKSLSTFLVLWLAMAFQPLLALACCWGMIAVILLQCWYVAFCLNLVLDAAAGEQELTHPFFSGNWFEDLIEPGFKFFVTWFVVRIRVLVFLFIAMLPGGIGALQFQHLLRTALLSASFGLKYVPPDQIGTFAALLVGGHFFWPMVVLVVAVGGIPGLLRIDLIAKTIVKTFPAYVCTVVLVYAALAIPFVYAATGLVVTKGSWIGALLVLLCFKGAEIYAMIVAMRVIGLYYYHFKHRFVWAWE